VKVVAVGECTRDRYIERDVDTVGGISLNFAVNARRSGAERVSLVSCIGRDAAGTAAQVSIEREGIDASHVHVLPGETASQAIRLTAGGERVFPPGGYRPGVLAEFQLTDTDLAFIASHDVVALAYFRQIKHLFMPALQAAAGSRLRVADLLDGEDLGVNLADLDPLLEALDVVFISGGAGMVERLLPQSRETGTIIVVTHGAAGSTALLRGERTFEPAHPVPVEERIDTTGCGDAFQAAFVVEYYRRRAIPGALQAGATRAAEVLRHIGATGG